MSIFYAFIKAIKIVFCFVFMLVTFILTCMMCSDYGLVGLVTLLPFVLFIILYKIIKKKMYSVSVKKQIEEANAYVSVIKNKSSLPSVETTLLLPKGETAIIQGICILLEPKSVRYSKRSGNSIRVSNFSVNSGTGISWSEEIVSKIDAGTLTLTDKRLIFDGSKMDRTILIKDIVSAKTNQYGIEISTSKRQKSMIFTVPSPLKWEICLKIICKVENPFNITEDLSIITEKIPF